MSSLSIPIWKEAPFIRLIIPLIAGILIEWYIGLPVLVYILMILICFVLIILFSLLKSFTRFKNYWLSGLLINVLMISMAGRITYLKDIRHDSNCITQILKADDIYAVNLTEPLMEKENSFKANAAINQVFFNDTSIITKGNIVIYFQKDSSLSKLSYNTRLCFHKKPQPIKNSGNPGSFDYERYCIFQQIFYQVYLKPGDYSILPGSNEHSFTGVMFRVRKGIVTILQTFIAGEKEAGLAEALLIGYKDDLDKNLVQQYSNTGVVHIIAISGLHLGLIYWLLNLLLRPLKLNGRLKLLKAILIISGLWLFSILTGGTASVCRSALMFTFIVIGENIGRRSNIYNSLAASAFVLLCYNPYWLWDAGFQLSYVAVLSIIIFMKPVYHLFYVKNKLLDHIWKMAAISIAAQILTTPVSIFHFQQFPNYFLITNIVAVPLSSLVVLAEIAVCGCSLVPYVATPVGNITLWLIEIMNGFINYINKMPFILTEALNLSLVQAILMYLIIISVSTWIFQKNRSALFFSLGFIIGFAAMKVYYKIQACNQQILVIYNVPHYRGIDLINGDKCLFVGDSTLDGNQSFQNFVLRPSRNKYRIKNLIQIEPDSGMMERFSIGNKRILLIKGDPGIGISFASLPADFVIVSGSPDINIVEMQKLTGCEKVIFDSSNSFRKINKWKADCLKAGIAFYSVPENGAFILNLN